MYYRPYLSPFAVRLRQNGQLCGFHFRFRQTPLAGRCRDAKRGRANIVYMGCSSVSSESPPPAPGQRPRSMVKLLPKLELPATAAYSPNFFNSSGFIVDELRYFVDPSGICTGTRRTPDFDFGPDLAIISGSPVSMIEHSAPGRQNGLWFFQSDF